MRSSRARPARNRRDLGDLCRRADTIAVSSSRHRSRSARAATAGAMSKRQERHAILGASNRHRSRPAEERKPRKPPATEVLGKTSPAVLQPASEPPSSPPPEPYNPFAEKSSRGAPVPLEKRRTLQTHLHKAGTLAGHQSGHSEIVQQVVRDFFLTRPVSTLVDIFRERDVDHSGSLDVNEFKGMMRQLNISLTEKDLNLLFRHADTDGSGVLEFQEFFNKFRNEISQPLSSQKEPFFWHKSRPRPLVDRHGRREMEGMLAGKRDVDLTSDELIEVVQNRVDRTAARQTFKMFDENRNGRLDVREFCNAMKHLHVNVSEAQAEAIIEKINTQHGSQMKANLTYAPFCATFKSAGELKQTVGGLGGQAMVHQSMSLSPASDLSPTSAASRADESPWAASAAPFLDSVSLLSAQTPRDQLGKTAPRSGRPSYAKPDAADDLSVPAHDKLSSWRGADGNFGDTQELTLNGQGLGRDIDWQTFKTSRDVYSDTVLKVPQEHAATFATRSRQHNEKLNALNGIHSKGTSGSVSAREASSKHFAGSIMAGSGSITDRACLLTVENQQRTKTMRDVFYPPDDAPAFASESERLVRSAREQLSPRAPVIKAQEREAAQVRTQRLAAQNRQRAEQLQDSMEARLARENAVNNGRIQARQSFASRNKDLQLVVESKEGLDVGKQVITTEPTLYSGLAAPHQSSHWQTIASHNHDPPPREHVKMVVSYRRSFPHAENRPETPVGASWGGVSSRAGFPDSPRITLSAFAHDAIARAAAARKANLGFA